MKYRVWTIEVEGDLISTTHGWLGGAIQKTEDIPGPSSRETAEERALSRAETLINNKLNKGYYECEPGTNNIIGERPKTSIDFSTAPPDGFEVFKPKPMPKPGSSEYDRMMKVVKNGSVAITRKYNGMKHILMRMNDGKLRLFTRRMEECTSHYPELIKEFEIRGIPPKTLLTLELYCKKQDGKGEDFKAMQSLSRSLPERAVRMQEENPMIIPFAAVIAPVYWGGIPLIRDSKVINWLSFMYSRLDFQNNKKMYGRVHSIQTLFCSFDKAIEKIQTDNMEGLVVYDGDSCFGEKAFNFRGKPERTDCWKQKPIFEDDFIAIFDPNGFQKEEYSRGGSYGSGKNMKRPKSLALFQYNKDHNLIYICNVGTGLDDATRDEIANAVEQKGYWSSVVSVEYAERKYKSNGDKTNALTFPSLQKIHEDKNKQECINENL